MSIAAVRSIIARDWMARKAFEKSEVNTRVYKAWPGLHCFFGPRRGDTAMLGFRVLAVECQAVYENMGVRGSIPINKQPPRVAVGCIRCCGSSSFHIHSEVCWPESDPSSRHYRRVCPRQQKATFVLSVRAQLGLLTACQKVDPLEQTWFRPRLPRRMVHEVPRQMGVEGLESCAANHWPQVRL